MGDAAVEEFGNILNSMLALKPPGVSGSKIKAVTELCVENVQSESVLIQKLYTHFKRVPGTHKLGVLYVVDSIVRAYIDEARKSGQDTSKPGPDGTFAAGVHRITDILLSLMNDITQYAPEDTKEKIKKLVDIWARGATFPSDLLNTIREKHLSPQAASADKRNNGSTTPIGSPPIASQMLFNGSTSSTTRDQTQPQQPNASNTAAILQALAQMAKQSNSASASSNLSPTAASYPPSMPSVLTAQPVAAGLHASSATPATSTVQPFASAPQPTPSSAMQSNLQNLFPGLLGSTSGFSAPQATHFPTQNPPPPTSLPLAGQATFPMLPQQGGNALDPAMLQNLAILQVLAQQGLAGPQLVQTMEQLGLTKSTPPNNISQPSWHQLSNQQEHQPQVGPYGQNSGERYDGDGDRNRGPFSPSREKHRRGRSRSRSPPYRHDDGPVRRRSPTYGDYEGSNGPGGRDRDYGKRGRGRGGAINAGGRGGYRRDRSFSPNHDRQSWGGEKLNRQPGMKYIDWDESLKPDRIRVLSRTLFVGGVSNSEAELRDLFQSHGDVQSCIVNYEKRHAFIKMKTREDAIKAKEAMETHKQSHMTLRTRWGVGFGPRDCSDYQTGVSDIPIDRLTEADKRWMLSAEYGGTGGRPMEPGMVIEEPDIEIGQGVSSKAISRRMQTDQAGAKGPKSTFQHRGGDRDRDRGDRERDWDHGDKHNINRGSRPYNGGHGRFERDISQSDIPTASNFGVGFPNTALGIPFYFPGQQPTDGQ